MGIVVNVQFSQDGVFYTNEKLKCRFRFTNSDHASYDSFNNKENIISRKYKNFSSSDKNCLIQQTDESQSVASSRSSSESFNRFSAFGITPQRAHSSGSYSRNESIEINNGLKLSPTLAFDENEESSNMKSNEFHKEITNGLSQSRTSMEVNSHPTIERHYRPSSVSSWFSSFSSSGFSDTKRNAAPKNMQSTREKLLWGFVQLVGHFVVDENLILTNQFEPLKSKRMYRAANGVGHGGTLGGGIFGHKSNGSQTHSRSSTLDDIKRQGESKLFPVYSTPPSVMFCDIALEPGESISYDYEIDLPEGLPPSFRGKSTRFLYYLIVGAQQGEINLEPNVIQLPFRLFSSLDELGKSLPYDLLDPTLIHTDDAIIKNINEKSNLINNSSKEELDKKEFLSMALRTLNLNPVNEEGDDENEVNFQFDILNIQSECLKNVHKLTRRAKPVSYTISKGDISIGKLMLKSSCFRIGDPISILIQFLPSLVKCYQVSITLESIEKIKEEYSVHLPSKVEQSTRQILAHQQSLVLNADRINLNLLIPVTCTPNFNTSVVCLEYRLRIEFLVGERSIEGIQSVVIDRFRTLNQMQSISGAEIEKLTCLVPIQLLPTNPECAKTYKSNHTQHLSKTPLP